MFADIKLGEKCLPCSRLWTARDAKVAYIFQNGLGQSLTELVGFSQAGEGGVESGALLLAGTKLLEQLAHLLLTHVQQTLQGHLARTHLLQAHTHKTLNIQPLE